MNPIRIVAAKPSDVDQMIIVEKKAFWHGYELWDADRFLHYINSNNVLCLLAKKNSNVVGKGIGVVYNRKNGKWLSIDDLSVLPECCRCGIGRKLLNSLEKRARKLGCVYSAMYVEEGNSNAIKLYNKMGYSNVRSYSPYYLNRMRKML